MIEISGDVWLASAITRIGISNPENYKGGGSYWNIVVTIGGVNVAAESFHYRMDSEEQAKTKHLSMLKAWKLAVLGT